MSPKSKSNGDLYHALRELWKTANPYESAKVREGNFQSFWKLEKQNRQALVDKQAELKLKVAGRGKSIFSSLGKHLTKNKRDGGIVTGATEADLLIETSSSRSESVPLESVPSVLPAAVEVISESLSNSISQSEERNENDRTRLRPAREKPAQDRTKAEICKVQQTISQMQDAKEAGLLSGQQLIKLKWKKKKLQELNSKLKRLKAGQNASRRVRRKQKRAIQKALSKPSNERVELQDSPGRPRLERDQPDLLDTIIKITTAHCSAHERRRSENLRCMKTLDDLLLELQERGFHISRTGLYLRLLPKRYDSSEGKRHVNTVPVKLVRPQNSLRKNHEDSHFAAAAVRYLKDLAGVLGEQTVFVLSQDDKARVPLGLPVATKQGPILMMMEYRVLLPDHDWVIASKHKLIPSVYAALEVKDGRVGYSGPTYIAIRSGKHDSSTAYSHAIDLENILKLNAFEKFCKLNNGDAKPIWIFMVDGGPDENPRFPKTLAFAAQHFKQHNLDALFVVTHAPHQSASNPVERRMAPLSRDLCGLILPHDAYGTHLDTNGKTIDTELEAKNFQKAGETLGETWSQRVIDGYEVEAEYIPRRGKGTGSHTGAGSHSYLQEGELDWLTEIWKARHVRQTQYLLQIMKCGNQSCCTSTRTNIRQFLGGSFLPAPVRFMKAESGLCPAPVESNEGSFMDLQTRLCMKFSTPNLPFDYFCPSLSKKLAERTCTACCIGYPTKKAYMAHQRLHRLMAINEELDEEESDDSDDTIATANNQTVSGDIHRIENLSAWLRIPFAEEQL